jgi:hypothetical protein
VDVHSLDVFMYRRGRQFGDHTKNPGMIKGENGGG